jgi:hypothetical protein
MACNATTYLRHVTFAHMLQVGCFVQAARIIVAILGNALLRLALSVLVLLFPDFVYYRFLALWFFGMGSKYPQGDLGLLYEECNLAMGLL